VPEEIPTDLDRLIRNSEAIASLNEASILSVGEFIKAEPVRLYLNMSQPIGVINGWLDEGLLLYYFAPQLDMLNGRNVRRFTQLMESLVVDYIVGEGMKWEQHVDVTGNPGIDDTILRTMKVIVKSRAHHSVLGFLSENYRRALFRTPEAGAPFRAS